MGNACLHTSFVGSGDDPNNGLPIGEVMPLRWGRNVASVMSLVRDDIADIKALRLPGRRLGLSGITDVHRILQTNNHVSELDLSRNSIGVEGAAIIGKCIYQNSVILRLCIAGNGLSRAGLEAMQMSLLHNHALTHLDMRDNLIRADGARVLQETIHFNGSIKHLDISRNGLGSDGVGEIAASIAHSFALTTLILSGNDMKDRGFRALCEGLTHNRSITHLDVSDNGITSLGTRILLTTIEESCILKVLNISDNNIAENGCKDLMSRLHRMKELTALFLHGCGILDEGMEYVGIAMADKGSAPLSVLDISANGLTILKPLIFSRPTLKVLDISGNSFAPETSKTILHHLKANFAIVSLMMEDCGFDNSVIEKSSFILKRNMEKWQVELVPLAPDRAARSVGQYIDMADGQLDRSHPVLAFVKRTKAIPPNKCSRLSLCGMGVEPYSLRYMCRELSLFNVQEIDLSCNDVQSMGLRTLIDFVKPMHSFTSLDLSNNVLKPTDMKIIGDILPSTVKALRLCGNPIGAIGLEFLQPAIRRCSLTELALDWCSLGAESISLFATFLPLSSLEILTLAGNGLGDEGIMQLVSPLVESRVTTLDVSLNNLTDTAGNKLYDTLRGVKRPITVVSHRNRMDCSLADRLEKKDAQILKGR